MRRIGILAVAMGLTAALAAGAYATSSRASGAGHIGQGDERRTFTFTAVEQGGQVTGRAFLDARGFPARVHTEITCLRVEGDTAYLSGVNTKADPDFFEGVWVIFGVRDGGEGLGATDQVTQYHPAATQGPNACLTDAPPTDWADIERGNIQVG